MFLDHRDHTDPPKQSATNLQVPEIKIAAGNHCCPPISLRIDSSWDRRDSIGSQSTLHKEVLLGSGATGVKPFPQLQGPIPC